MSKFPDSVNIPQEVFAKRRSRYKNVLEAVTLGIKFRLSIIVFEMIGYFFINSASLFMDIAASIIDTLTSLFLILCIRLARRPPDKEHPFGHGRYEPLGGLLLGIFLGVMGGIFLVQQLFGALQQDMDHHIHSWAWIFPAIAVILLEACYQMMMKTAKDENSPALAADAAHYRTDSLTSFMAMLALLIAAFLPEWGMSIDRLGAILIDLFMIFIGFSAARENFNQLMDRVPDKAFFELVKSAARQVEGVKETEKVLIQQYGPDAHVDIDIEVLPSLSVDVAHQISQKVRVEIQKAWPAVRDVTVHIEPYYPNDH